MNLDTLVEAYIRANAQLAFVIAESTLVTNIPEKGTSVTKFKPDGRTLGPRLIKPNRGSSTTPEQEQDSRKTRSGIIRAARKRAGATTKRGMSKTTKQISVPDREQPTEGN